MRRSGDGRWPPALSGHSTQEKQIVSSGLACTARSEALAKSPDYPSGHASWGWAVGLILAELAPDRAVPILQRARAAARRSYPAWVMKTRDAAPVARGGAAL